MHPTPRPFWAQGILAPYYECMYKQRLSLSDCLDSAILVAGGQQSGQQYPRWSAVRIHPSLGGVKWALRREADGRRTQTPLATCTYLYPLTACPAAAWLPVQTQRRTTKKTKISLTVLRRRLRNHSLTGQSGRIVLKILYLRKYKKKAHPRPR